MTTETNESILVKNVLLESFASSTTNQASLKFYFIPQEKTI